MDGEARGDLKYRRHVAQLRSTTSDIARYLASHTVRARSAPDALVARSQTLRSVADELLERSRAIRERTPFGRMSAG